MTRRTVYLHGFASGPFSRKAAYFQERFRDVGLPLEVPDLAEGNFEGLTITGQLAVLARAVRNEPVSLVGSSMGGYLAALYAARHPEVERLVLLAPAFGFARRWSESLGESQLEEWKRTRWLNVYHYADQKERRLGYQLIEDGLQYEDYPQFTQPALIFHGRQDTVVPASYSEEFAASHQNARLVLLDSGHELTDALDRIWSQARAFLAPPDASR